MPRLTDSCVLFGLVSIFSSASFPLAFTYTNESHEYSDFPIFGLIERKQEEKKTFLMLIKCFRIYFPISNNIDFLTCVSLSNSGREDREQAGCTELEVITN